MLTSRIRTLMPFESRGDTVMTYHSYFANVWRTVLRINQPKADDYDINFWEFKRHLRARYVRPLDRRHVIVVQGQQLPPDFYTVLRLLSVEATVFVDPVQTVDASGTTLEDLTALLGAGTATTSHEVDGGTAQIHELLAHLGDRSFPVAAPHREGPRPVLVDHEDVDEEIRFVVEQAAAHRDRQIGVFLPTRELAQVFKDGIGDLFDGRTQWHLSGVKVPKHATITWADPGVKVLTWVSAIGMRFDHVVLAGLDHVEDRFRLENALRVLGPTTRSELFLSYSGVGRPTSLSGLTPAFLDDRTRDAPGGEWVEADGATVEFPTPHPAVPEQTAPPTRSAVDSARALLVAPMRSNARSKRLLTADQEVGLAQLMRSADEDLSDELPKGFRSTLRDNDVRARAFDAMVLHNTGLVGSCIGRHLGAGLDYEDLYQHGLLGLMRAIEKWDASRGLKFSTYAVNWINQHMGRAVPDEGATIRLPVHKHEEVRKVRAVRNRLLLEQEDAPIAEIAKRTGFSWEKVVDCLRLSRGVISLDAPLGADGEISLAELVPAPFEHHSNPDYVLDNELGAELVRKALSLLKEREAEVLRLRFGFDGGDDRTLEKIGEHFSVTRERIRQIESKAKSKLVGKLADVGLTAGGATPTPSKEVSLRRLSVVRTPVHELRRPGTEIATGSGLVERLGAAGEDSAFGHLLIALVDRALWSGARHVRIRTAGAGTSSRLALVHDGAAFAGHELLSNLREGQEVSRGSATLGVAAALYDEVTAWDAHTSSACLVLTSAADTDTWWLHRATRRLPTGLLPEVKSDQWSVVLLRAPRPQVARTRVGVVLDRCVRDLGVVFGELLRRKAEIDVNGRAVTAQDPFLWGNPAGQHLGEERVTAAGLSVVASPRVLPHPDALRAGDTASVGDPADWQMSQGFYVRCDGRYLSRGGWLGIDGLEMTEDTALARVLVEVPSEQRAAWGGEHPGATVVPPEPLRSRLAALARIARGKSELVIERHRSGGTT
ncbi:RNA polymerase sigma factor (sigma-70 family) [Saccharothrix tamanrassetensis]|uniref:RNA polymerase sigma factor (Sigma-70 family) n=1 Tax=Saccharothrix tamanrassetensis TaxID=1051531 RepID=A0A841CQQ1_9PSEU|nr:RNA polymerase sigma factor RpoD/SigA [Saccharothrix tamanrassetensis]MBB5958458.1 RNA polymerase sigma factor (sigma-70 family) [Saccharothrix tamanrassetensis]